MQPNKIPTLSRDHFSFPEPGTALTSPNGLLAMGGDLSPNRLIAAYEAGIFPWYDDSTPILWWSPDPRTVLWLDHWVAHKSLRKLAKHKSITYRADTQFKQVIDACADRESEHNENQNNPPNTWITAEMKTAYQALHQLGFAHSIEIYEDDELQGGLYGISLGRNFFAESMFHRKNNFSKLAIWVLVEQLTRWNFTFIDCQVWSKHLGSLGATEIPRTVFLQNLQTQLKYPTRMGRWVLDHDLLW